MGDKKMKKSELSEKIISIVAELIPQNWYYDDKQGSFEIDGGYVNPFGANGDEEVVYYGKTMHQEKKLPFKLTGNNQNDAKRLIDLIKEII